jgi:hypothetical protein
MDFILQDLLESFTNMCRARVWLSEQTQDVLVLVAVVVFLTSAICNVNCSIFQLRALQPSTRQQQNFFWVRTILSSSSRG